MRALLAIILLLPACAGAVSPTPQDEARAKLKVVAENLSKISVTGAESVPLAKAILALIEANKLLESKPKEKE